MLLHVPLCLLISITTPIERAKLTFSVPSRSFLLAKPRQGGNSISGHVFNKQRRPVEQLIVELLNDLGSAITQTRTNSSGRYEFRGLPQGIYQVRVLTYGTSYIPQVERVEIVNFTFGGRVSGAQNVPVDFVLNTPKVEASPGMTGTVFVQSVPDDARKLFEQADESLDLGRSNQGLAELQQAIQAFPKYFLALERLGTELVKREQYESARTVLTEATEVNSRAYQSFYWLGLANHNLKQPAAAVEALTRAVSLAPTSVNSQVWLGIVLRQSGKLEQAETHLRKAKELSKKNRIPEVHWQLALLYNKLERHREAADELELFLKAQPDSRDAENIKKLVKQMREKTKLEQNSKP